MIPTVAIESPFAGDVERNKKYLARCVADCLKRGESPYASHAFFTQFLDDNVPERRELGIEAGFAWSTKADFFVFYCDYGISNGMAEAFETVKERNKKYLIRYIGKNEDADIVE